MIRVEYNHHFKLTRRARFHAESAQGDVDDMVPVDGKPMTLAGQTSRKASGILAKVAHKRLSISA